MDWSNSLKNSKFMSKIFRTYTAVRKRLAWYFMLLSKNPYPIGKSSKEFKISAVICAIMAINTLYNAVMLMHANSIGMSLLYGFTMLIAIAATWMNFNTCLKMKQRVYNEKVKEASQNYSLSYEAAVISLAAMYPALELDRDMYNAWYKEWNKPFIDCDFASMYPTHLSTTLKDFLKHSLQGP